MNYTKNRHLNTYEMGLTDEYRITTEKGFYSLIVDYIGCNIEEETDINKISPENSIQAYINLNSKNGINDRIIELFNKLNDIEQFDCCISGIDTDSYNSTQTFINNLLESL